jgi:hypothetical protein
MEAVKKKSDRDTPEQFLHGLARKLTHHALWDALLMFLPPLAAVLYCLYYLFTNLWVGPLVAAVLALTAAALGALAIFMRYRPHVPSIGSVARLIDDRAGAKDRFLTLATLSSPPAPTPMLSRLRREAVGLQGRVAIKREFPYRISRQVYLSLLISLAAAVLFSLLLPLAHSTLHPQPVQERLRELAQRMALRPNLGETARSLQNFAAKLEDSKLPPQEKQQLARDEREKVEEQGKKQTEPLDRELLNQAAGELQGVEQQSGGAERKKDQDGGGGIQSNLPQQGQREGQQSEGSGASNKGDLNAQSDNETRQGKALQPKPQDRGKEQSQAEKNAGSGNQPDPNQAGKDQSNERPGKTDGGRDERAGRSKVSEEIPQGNPPPERFYKPGEGEYQGIKGAGYVTVQLPEELAAEGKSSGQKKNLKGSKTAGSQLPINNVPLPKHVPDAPSEKQQMPLEYRSIIR